MEPEEEEWRVGDILLTTTDQAKKEGYERAKIIGRDGERYLVQRTGHRPNGEPYEESNFYPSVLPMHFKVDIDSRVSDEDVEKARKGLKELLN